MQQGSKSENKFSPPTDVKSVLQMFKKPKKVVVTAGMPYANGPLHLGHLAGAHVPADIYARWMRMLIGSENVLFVNGNDDHKDAGNVRVAFTSPAAAATVRDWLQQRLTKAGFTLSADRAGLTGKTDDGKPFALRLTDEGASKSSGTIEMGD